MEMGICDSEDHNNCIAMELTPLAHGTNVVHSEAEFCHCVRPGSDAIITRAPNDSQR